VSLTRSEAGQATLDEVAERLSAATGRQVRYVDAPPDTFRALAGAGLPGWLVDRLIDAAGVTDEVATLLGRQPRTFEQFAAEHRAAFGGEQ